MAVDGRVFTAARAGPHPSGDKPTQHGPVAAGWGTAAGPDNEQVGPAQCKLAQIPYGPLLSDP